MKRELLLLCIFLVLVAGLTIVLYNTLVVVEVLQKPLTLQVKDHVGLNFDPDAIHFGGGPPGAILDRTFNLTTTEPLYVSIHVTGPIKEFVSVTENDFLIKPGELKSITLFATIPEVPKGWYNGTLIIYLKRWNI
jgi:hypothetical protein